MKKLKQLGVWMDHSIAYLMDHADGEITTKVLESESYRHMKDENKSTHDAALHFKQRAQLANFYQNLSAEIQFYNEVILFGPTGAKRELFNLLRENHLFNEIDIQLKQEDKMTEEQQQFFVLNHFK